MNWRESPRISRRGILKAGAALGAGSAVAAALAACGGNSSSSGSSQTAPVATQAAGTSQAGASPAAKAQSGTLDYPTWMLGEAGVGDYWKDTINTFQQQNPGITLKTTNIPSNDYEDKTATQIAGGSIPDIYPVFTNMMPRLMSQGLLAPLDEYLNSAPWKNQELPILKVGQRDGKTYGVVLTASPQGLLYNKQLLDKAGVSVPTTADEFLTACKAVKDKTGAWGFVFPMDTSQVQDTYISTMQWVLGYGSDWAKPDGTPSANDPKTVDGMTFQMKLIQSGTVPTGMKVLDARALFKDGKVAFMLDGPWVMTYVQTENPTLYPAMGYAAPPTPTHAAITGGAFFTIPKDSKFKETAWKYIAMVNQETWQRRWLEDLVQLPSQSIKASDAYLQKNPWVADMIDTAAKYQAGFGYAPPAPMLAPSAAEFRQIVMDGVSPIWTGSKSVKDGLDALQQQLVDWEKSKNITPGK
ncbi:MAG: ABC transporter substrate-binding protein [Thermomicrobiales bacterium]